MSNRTHDVRLNENQVRVIMLALEHLPQRTIPELASATSLEEDPLDIECALPDNMGELFNTLLNMSGVQYSKDTLNSFVL